MSMTPKSALSTSDSLPAKGSPLLAGPHRQTITCMPQHVAYHHVQQAGFGAEILRPTLEAQQLWPCDAAAGMHRLPSKYVRPCLFINTVVNRHYCAHVSGGRGPPLQHTKGGKPAIAPEFNTCMSMRSNPCTPHMTLSGSIMNYAYALLQFNHTGSCCQLTVAGDHGMEYWTILLAHECSRHPAA